MAHPAFESCLAHAHMGLTWIHHMQMTGFMHACKGLVEYYVDDASTYVCKGLAESYVDNVIHTAHRSLRAF